MLGIAREEQSNPSGAKIFRGTTGANVVADATPDADRTLRLQSMVPHFSLYPYIGLGHCYKRSARPWHYMIVHGRGCVIKARTA